MKLRWGEEQIKYFSKPVTKAERNLNWAWVLMIFTVVITMIIALRRIF